MSFVRGNTLLISGHFWNDGDVQPSSATCTLRYRDLTNRVQTTTITLTSALDADSHYFWSGSWDSSVAGPGRVEWAVQSSGALCAAAEGDFEIIANRANGAQPPDWPCGDEEFRG